MEIKEPKIQKTVTAPTPLRPDLKQAMIAYIQDTNKPLPLDLSLIVEILYRESIGEAVDHLARPMPATWSLLSKEAATWAGLDRRDPYVDVLKYPDSPTLNEIRHTFATIVYTHADGNKVGAHTREALVKILEAMPEQS